MDQSLYKKGGKKPVKKGKKKADEFQSYEQMLTPRDGNNMEKVEEEEDVD